MADIAFRAYALGLITAADAITDVGPLATRRDCLNAVDNLIFLHTGEHYVMENEGIIK